MNHNSYMYNEVKTRAEFNDNYQSPGNRIKGCIIYLFTLIPLLGFVISILHENSKKNNKSCLCTGKCPYCAEDIKFLLNKRNKTKNRREQKINNNGHKIILSFYEFNCKACKNPVILIKDDLYTARAVAREFNDAEFFYQYYSN